MKSPIPQRGGLPVKEIIHALRQLCLKLVEEQDPVGFNDKSWVLQYQLISTHLMLGPQNSLELYDGMKG